MSEFFKSVWQLLAVLVLADPDWRLGGQLRSSFKS